MVFNFNSVQKLFRIKTLTFVVQYHYEKSFNTHINKPDVFQMRSTNSMSCESQSGMVLGAETNDLQELRQPGRRGCIFGRWHKRKTTEVFLHQESGWCNEPNEPLRLKLTGLWLLLHSLKLSPGVHM